MQRSSWRERTSPRTVRWTALVALVVLLVCWSSVWHRAMQDTAHNVSSPHTFPVSSSEQDTASSSTRRGTPSFAFDDPHDTEKQQQEQPQAVPQSESNGYATLRAWMTANPQQRYTQRNNTCSAKLYTPTYVTKLFDDMYVIVDCWHHRVLVHYRLDAPIDEWVDLIAAAGGNSPLGAQMVNPSRMQSFKIPHSVATNGEIVVTESSVGGSNGQDHSVVVLRRRKRNDEVPPPFPVEFLEEVPACENNKARRPHRIIYDEATAAFYLYLTSPAFLSKFVWNSATQHLERVFCQSLPFMKGMYARSIVTLNQSLFITAGPGVIWQTNLKPDRVVPVRSYSIKPLGFAKGKMNDLAYIDGWWYATSTVPCAIVRFRSLDRLGQHEKLSKSLGLCGSFSRKEARCSTGTPYFVSRVGDRIVVPYIFGCSGVVSFRDDGSGPIRDVVQHFDQGWVEGADDLLCRTEEW